MTEWKSDETIQLYSSRLKEIVIQAIKFINEKVIVHPLVEKCHKYTTQIILRLYKRSLPYIAQIAENSVLAASLGFALGVCITYLMVSAYYTSYYASVIKSRSMSGVTFNDYSYGGLEGIHLRSDLVVPKITQPNQVLIRVHAASLDFTDVAVLSGLGRNERRLHTRKCRYNGENVIIGRDFSGVVLDVGKNVTNVDVGDGVWSARPLAGDGSLVEFIVIDSWALRLKPAHLSHDGAATLPYSSLKLWEALVYQAGIKPLHGLRDKKVLVVDGGSPTGCIALQACTLYIVFSKPSNRI